MSPRQRIRLREVRKNDLWDDQHSPAEIDLAENVAVDEQDLLNYIMSQIRQVTGMPHWHNPVPIPLTDLSRLACLCAPTDTVGSLVYASGSKVGGLYQVQKADPANYDKMPVIGMIVQKDDLTHASVQYTGPVAGLFSGMTPGRTYFIGLTGQIALTPPTGEVYVQKIGVAIDSSVLLLVPDLTMIKRRA